MKEKNLKIPIHIKKIDILDVNIAFPGPIIQENKMFHYNINLQHKINQENKLVFVETSVEVLDQNKETRFAKLRVSCAYYVEELLRFKSDENDKLINLPSDFISTLNSISLSTTRGIMYSSFRGTFLHNAILPVLDPNKFRTGK